MKIVAVLLGLALLAVAGMYFLLPAQSLPEFFPGFEAGSTRTHVTHGLAALVAGVILLGFAWLRGRKA